MKNFKAKILTFFGAILAAASLAGCKPSTNADEQFAVYDGSKVTIRLYTTQSKDTLQPITDNAIVEFQKMFPNITVEHTTGFGYNDLRDQVKTEISIGEQPNLAYCYPDHVALYNKAKAVQTLDDYIDSKAEITDALGNKHTYGLTKEQKDDFIPGFFNAGANFGDGRMYTLPYSKSTEVLYYNKTFFTAHNLTVPTTWEEFETVAAQIKTIDKEIIPLGYDSDSNWFITLCEQYGYDYTKAEGEGMEHFTFDNAGTRGFVKKLAEWYAKGYVTTQGLYGTYTSALFTATSGVRCVMCVGSSAGANHQIISKDGTGDEVGITTMPQVSLTKQKAISQGPDLVIFRKTNVQEVAASWLLAKYLTTDFAYQAAFASASGYMPPIKSVTASEAFQQQFAKADGFNGLPYQSIKYCMDHTDMYFVSPAFIGSSEARDQVGTIISTVLGYAGEHREDSDYNALVEAKINEAYASALEECRQATL